jgi:phosphonate transport system substrate-binding protein
MDGNMMRLLHYYLPGCLLAILLISNSQAETNQQTLTFGIVPQQSATKLARMWTPLMEYLSTQTGHRLQFKTAPNIPEFEQRLANGEYDLAYMNPYHYTTFHRSPGYQAFAKQKDKYLKGIIVVRADSPYQDLSELSDQTLAFPAPAAFAASIVTRAEFSSLGIPITPKYVSSHDSVYRSVAKGIYPAGGGVVRTLKGLEPEIQEQLRILWTSPPYTPHALAAHPRVTADTVSAISAAMQQLDESEQGRQLLKQINFKGVVAANDADWDDIRKLDIDLLDGMVATPATAQEESAAP